MTTRRRRLAVAALVALLAASAGCSALGGGGGSGTDIQLANDDDVGHDVTVELAADGETVYEDSASVGPETDADLDDFDETGEYTVLVTLDGRTAQFSYEFDGSGTVTVGVDDSGGVFMG